jgi:hypothetical protein
MLVGANSGGIVSHAGAVHRGFGRRETLFAGFLLSLAAAEIFPQRRRKPPLLVCFALLFGALGHGSMGNGCANGALVARIAAFAAVIQRLLRLAIPCAAVAQW